MTEYEYEQQVARWARSAVRKVAKPSRRHNRGEWAQRKSAVAAAREMQDRSERLMGVR